MKGLGTIINVIAVITGGGLGLLLKNGLKQHYQDTMIQALGLSTIFVGLMGAIQGMLVLENGTFGTQGTLLMVLSLAIGSVIGEFFNIELQLERFGEWLKKKAHAQNNTKFVEAFVTTSLVICVGAMAIVGALEDGLTGNYSTLLIKSVLDFAIVIVFASTLGIGTLFSAIPIAIWEGGITIASVFVAPYMSEVLIRDLSMVGFVLICGVGINLLFNRGIKVANLLPALLGPIIYHMFF